MSYSAEDAAGAAGVWGGSVTSLNSRSLWEPQSSRVLSGHLEGDVGGIVGQGVFSTEKPRQ